MMRSLIIGMNFGAAVYKPALKSLGYDIISVDPTAPAMYKTIQEAIDYYQGFETVNICTPNYTHEEIVRQVASHSKIIFVEKPGVKNSFAWDNLVKEFPETRISMVKNNQYREEIARFKELALTSKKVTINWINHNRIPNPGSWFTNKDLAFGGVSRDLMPHLLSYYTVLSDYKNGQSTLITAKQNYQLANLTTTDYGIVNKDGVYNVDDYCQLKFTNNDTEYDLTADWKSGTGVDQVYIDFDGVRFDLGLCPEIAYREMIRQAVKNKNNNDFWREQYEQDMWIHQQIENL